MRPMSVREMDALCYERGIEFDPAEVPVELAELAHGIVGHPGMGGTVPGLGALRAPDATRVVLGAGPASGAWEREVVEAA